MTISEVEVKILSPQAKLLPSFPTNPFRYSSLEIWMRNEKTVFLLWVPKQYLGLGDCVISCVGSGRRVGAGPQ